VRRVADLRELVLLPKVHLHVHLESTIRPATAADLATANGLEPPSSASAFADFGQFAEHSGRVRDLLQRPEDFRRIADEFCADQAADGVRYVEVTFTAAGHGTRLGDLAMPLEAVLDGLAAGAMATGIGYGVILDHPRRQSAIRARQTLELARRYAADGVVGIGLAGREEYPVRSYGGVWTEAGEAGLHRVHHAGETAGPQSIRDVLSVGRADRIGHGIRILDDPELMEELAARDVPLEVCPSSNLALGIVGSLDAHPLPEMIEAGLRVTINTDVPDVTGVTLSEEYGRLRDAFGFDDATIARFNRAAIEASFAPREVRAALQRDTTAWLAGDRAGLGRSVIRRGAARGTAGRRDDVGRR
jgi:adenosine deaminase